MLCFVFALLLLAKALSDNSLPPRTVRQSKRLFNDLKRQIHRNGLNRPFVTLSFAQTVDGSIASSYRERLNISSSYAFSLKHSLRRIHDGILIGVDTLLIDEPRLTVRNPMFLGKGSDLPENLRPVVLDSTLKISSCSSVLLEKPIVFTCATPSHPNFQQIREKLESLGGELVTCPADNSDRCSLIDCLQTLQSRFGIRSVLVEGGARIIQTCIESNLVDQVVLFINISFLGGYRCLCTQLSQRMYLEKKMIVEFPEELVIYGKICSSQSTTFSS